MPVVSFLHQKGGTGKSTLALAAACALAARGERVLLIDADPQGTAQEWGLRHGRRFGVAVEAHILPDFPAYLPPLARQWPTVLLDGPPSLSPVTESLLQGSHRVIIPVRPALPDVWALPWFAALLRRLHKAGHAVEARLVFNMHRDEPLEPLQAEAREWGVPVAPMPLPADPAFAALFTGQPLPEALAAMVLEALGW